MCGICGILKSGQAKKSSTDFPGLVKKYTERMIHRGPDEAGFFNDDNVSLGMRRLMIIDLDTGSQPVFSEDRRIVTVFNGEIYNFRELRKELVNKGHKFITSSDTEVIVHLYEEHGTGLVDRLNGMFAIALWDMDKKQLFLARDRAGQKPFYIWKRPDNSIAFASELKCLTSDPDFNERPVDLAVHHYMSLGYIPAPMSIFENVIKLRPGHTIKIETKNKKGTDSGFEITQKRYWKPEYSIKSVGLTGLGLSQFRDLLYDSVKKRMISDVPLGAFLSGGIDSAAVTAMMARLSKQPVKAFTIGFEDPRYNELPQACLVADKFGCRHITKVIDPSKDVQHVMQKLAYQYDEPYSDSSALPTWHLSELASQHVTVALNGDAGDEVFGGYDRYRAYLMLEMLKSFKLFKGAVPAGKRFFDLLASFGIKPRSRTMLNRIKRFCESAMLNSDAAYASWISIFSSNQKQSVYSDSMKKITSGIDSFEWLYSAMAECRSTEKGEKLMACDLMTYLPNDLLAKVDIASMAWSLECRSPFLDYRVINRAASLPMNSKVNLFKGKLLLRKLFKGIIPDEILNRKKRGFGIPLDDWFRNDLKAWSREIILDSADFHAERWFSKKGLEKMLDSHLQGENHGFRIWNLVMLHLWLDSFKKD
jgi:asparagine synthase (glutamine-hydrolysing)